MKRLVCVVILVCLLLYGCGKQQYEVGTFSYTKHCAQYASAEFGVFISDPEGQKIVSIRNGDAAVKVAKKYCRFPSLKSALILMNLQVFIALGLFTLRKWMDIRFMQLAVKLYM